MVIVARCARSGRRAISRHRLALVLAVALAFVGTALGSEPEPGRPTVLLLHGLARSAGSMAPLAAYLDANGFEVHNLDYESTEHPPEELVVMLRAEVQRCCARGATPLHFVTHSLGGIVVRAYLAGSKPERLGRVVQIAPPNSGSEIVDAIGDNALFEALLGETATRLGTDAGSFPNSIGAPDYELGVIAGSSSINPIGSALLSGPNDGTVTIDSARLDGAADFLVVDANHTFIMQDEAVMAQVAHFLRVGRFEHGAPAASSEAAGE